MSTLAPSCRASCRTERLAQPYGHPSGEGGVGTDDSCFLSTARFNQAPFIEHGARSLASSNHSQSPNAGYLWQVEKTRTPHTLAGALWIMALSPPLRERDQSGL